MRLTKLLPPHARYNARARLAIENGDIDPELLHLSRYLPADRRRLGLDVGANCGVTSYAIARALNKVIAFEPNPAVYDTWSAGAPLNIDLRNLAVSNQPGEVKLSIPILSGKPQTGWASLGNPLASYDKLQTVVVNAVTLDGFCSDLGITDVDFIKIDVEGYELAVLEGAKRLLEESRPWMVVEVDDDKRPVLRDFLTAIGYRIYESTEASVLKIHSISKQNVVCEPT